jgi:hypothetical protein
MAACFKSSSELYKFSCHYRGSIGIERGGVPMQFHSIKETFKINPIVLKLKDLRFGDLSTDLYHIGNMIRNGSR